MFSKSKMEISNFNQSEAEKGNRLLFGEQWNLFFSKSKMAATNIRPIRSRIKIQDGRHKFQPIRCRIKIQDGRHKFQPIKCRIKIQDGRHRFQPIKCRSKIQDGRHKFQPIRSSHATSKLILTVSCGLKRQRSVRQVAMMKTERLGSEVCL